MYFFTLLLIMATWFDNEDFSLAGLTQESHEVDIETISSDEESVDSERNFRLLLEGAKALSNNVSQISNFDDKIFQLSYGDTSCSEVEISNFGESSISMASSMPSSGSNLHVSFSFFRCF